MTLAVQLSQRQRGSVVSFAIMSGDRRASGASERCPRCSSEITAPIVYGEPALPVAEIRQRLGGTDLEFESATTPEPRPNWVCRNCALRFATPPRNDLFFSREQSAQLRENARELSALYARHAPKERSQSVDNATVYLMACLARCHYTMTTILDLQHREIDCVALARSLYEHAVTFAWVAINPAEHYPMLQRTERDERLKLVKDVARYGALAPAESMGKRALIDAGNVPAPSVAVRARQADNHWDRVGTGWKFNFLRGYASIFRFYSGWVHASIMGVDPFVSRHPEQGPRVGLPDSDVWPEIASTSVACFADALVIAAWRLHWPPLNQVVVAYSKGFK